MNDLLDRPDAIDWTTRQTTARIPFQVVDGLPVNPVQPDLPAGQGQLNHMGEKACADVAVFVTVAGIRWLLLGKRDDGNGWGLPGGKLETGETDLGGGLRELDEETGLAVDPTDPTVVISVGGARYVPDPRAGRHAWMVTSLIVVDLGERPVFPAARATDELPDVAWFPARTLPQLEATIAVRDPRGQVFHSHREMLTHVLN